MKKREAMNKERRIGSSDLTVFPINLGGNVFGWTASEETSHEVLDAFIEGGGNFVDTADSYSRWVEGHKGGESETIIGTWLSKRKNRDQIVLATKVAHHPQRRGLRAQNVRAALDDSLARLQTDHVDLYYAHWDDEPDIPMEEIAGVFSELVDTGKVRYPAISNMSPQRIREWVEVSRSNGLHVPVALQPQYSLVERADYEGPKQKLAQELELGVMPYYSLASGFLSGKYRPGVTVDSQRAGDAGKYLDDPRSAGLLQVLDATAAAHNTQIASVALAWILAQPGITAPICSASKVEQVSGLLAAGQLQLDADELDSLTKAFA